MMRWLRNRDSGSGAGGAVPDVVVAALGLDRRERLLAGCPMGTDREHPLAWLVATTWRLSLHDPDGTVSWTRPWHEVQAASWSREAGELTVVLIGQRRPLQAPMPQDRTFLQVLRERVQASVISTEEVAGEGSGALAAALRRDLRTGEILEQVIGRAPREGDPRAAALAEAFDRLREEAGLPPRGSVIDGNA